MVKHNRNTYSRVIGLILMMVMLGACSTSGSGSKGEEKPGTNATKDPVEIVFYAINGDTEESFNFRFGDALRKKFPNYKISYIFSQKGTTLPEMIAAGTHFDVTYHAMGFYESFTFPYELQYDMTELIKKHKVDLNRFEPTAIEAIKQISDGKMYSIPVYGNSQVLYYNKAIFNKFGIAYPKDGMTWKETAELSKKLTRLDNGVQYAGLGMVPAHLTRMNPLSIPNVDLKTNTPTINSDERWKRYFQTLFVDPLTAPGSLSKVPDLNAFEKDQNVAMMIYLSSLISIHVEELKKLDWDMVSLPTFDDTKGAGSQINSINFGMTRTAKHKDEIMEVLAYMVTDEFQSDLSRKGIMPVLKSEAVRNELGKESAFKDKNLKAIFRDKPAPVPAKTLYDADMVNVYAKYATQVWQGTVDINTALRLAEEEGKLKIAEFLNKTK